MTRLWGIRHLRWAWHSVQVRRYATAWYFSGKYRGPGDYLDAIWRGEQ